MYYAGEKSASGFIFDTAMVEHKHVSASNLPRPDPFVKDFPPGTAFQTVQNAPVQDPHTPVSGRGTLKWTLRRHAANEISRLAQEQTLFAQAQARLAQTRLSCLIRACQEFFPASVGGNGKDYQFFFCLPMCQTMRSRRRSPTKQRFTRKSSARKRAQRSRVSGTFRSTGVNDGATGPPVLRRSISMSPLVPRERPSIANYSIQNYLHSSNTWSQTHPDELWKEMKEQGVPYLPADAAGLLEWFRDTGQTHSAYYRLYNPDSDLPRYQALQHSGRSIVSQEQMSRHPEE